MSKQSTRRDSVFLLAIFEDEAEGGEAPDMYAFETEEDMLGGLAYHEEQNKDLVFRCYKALDMQNIN